MATAPDVTNTKFCIFCKHAKPARGMLTLTIDALCSSPRSVPFRERSISYLVTSEYPYSSCVSMRMTEAGCGEKGVWWEVKNRMNEGEKI